MKAVIMSVASLLVGLAIGCYGGYRYYERHITSEAIRQMVEAGESSDALAAVTSARAIALIDSGEPQRAVETLSRPIAHYYFIFATSTFTNEQRLKVRAMIDDLAMTNQTVASEIAQTRSLR